MELVVLDGNASRRRFTLRGPTITIGRSPDCDIVLDDPEASRHHAEISFVDGVFVIQDVQAANPTLLNDQLLVEPTALRHGDLLVIGGVLLQAESPVQTEPADRPASQAIVPDEPETRAELPIPFPSGPPRPTPGAARSDEIAVEADVRSDPRAAPSPGLDISQPRLLPSPSAVGQAALRSTASRLSAAASRLSRSTEELSSTILALERRRAEAVRACQLLDEITSQHDALGGDPMIERLLHTVRDLLDNQTSFSELQALGRDAPSLARAVRTAQASLLLSSILSSGEPGRSP